MTTRAHADPTAAVAATATSLAVGVSAYACAVDVPLPLCGGVPGGDETAVIVGRPSPGLAPSYVAPAFMADLTGLRARLSRQPPVDRRRPHEVPARER